MSCGSVDSQYLVGALFALGPFDQQPLLAQDRPFVAVSPPQQTRSRAKREDKRLG